MTTALEPTIREMFDKLHRSRTNEEFFKLIQPEVQHYVDKNFNNENLRVHELALELAAVRARYFHYNNFVEDYVHIINENYMENNVKCNK